MTLYILDAHGEPAVEADLQRWARWFEETDRSLARDQIGDRLVSTVFLGIDHDYTGQGEPVLWETMVFSKEGRDVYSDRYTSRAEALDGHRAACWLAQTDSLP